MVGRIFTFSSSNPTPKFGLGHNRSNRVNEPRRSILWTLYLTLGYDVLGRFEFALAMWVVSVRTIVIPNPTLSGPADLKYSVAQS